MISGPHMAAEAEEGAEVRFQGKENELQCTDLAWHRRSGDGTE